MDTLGITRFEDLIAHLDGLVKATRVIGVESEAIDFVATIRTRLVRIHNHLSDQPTDTEPSVSPKPKTVTDVDDMIHQFGEIAEAARGAGLSPTLSHYLHTARLRLRFTLRGQSRQDSRRIVSREESSGTAYMRWEGGETEVEVVDSSAYGLGVVADARLAENAVVEISREEEGRQRRYDCLVVNDQPHRFQYYLGLEIFQIKG